MVEIRESGGAFLMLLELHCHTSEHSRCSVVGAADLIRQVHAKGLQGLVFTDHHYLWPVEELHEVRREAGVPDHFLIFSGQEVTTSDSGDVLVYGAPRSIRRGSALKTIRARCPEAALVLAHPFRNGERPGPEKLLNPLLDAVEIFSANHTVSENSRGLQAWHTHKFTAIAGTDTHGPGYAGTYPTLFDHPVATVENLVGELRKGRCRPFFKEIPKAGSQLQVSEITIGTKGADEVRERIIIKSLRDRSKWKSAARAYEIMRVVAEHGFSGGTYRVPRPIDADPESMTLIEQGLRGKTLFEKVLGADAESARHFVQLAAEWLAKLHNCRLQVTPPGEFLDNDEKRLDRYVRRFAEITHPHTRRARETKKAVRRTELDLFQRHSEHLVQGHGDYHPKNIYIGQDRLDNWETLYVAAIDFDSSACLPPAFDVGTFLAQFRNQLFAYPHILREVPEEVFLNAYLAMSTVAGPDFLRQVELFRARTNLGIAAFLIKLGLGDSENLWRVLVEAERAMAHVAAAG
jgi:predicted metal-dependent phosphoesterase TrpH/aminoglycoside/choline kinase family phosphotransferase